MARIRSINPGAPTDEDVATMSMAARLVWAYLPCHADKLGRLIDKPFGLKLDILPTDNVDMHAILEELAQRRHIIRYVVDGRRYMQIRSFLRYQRPHKHETESSIPPPPDAYTDTPKTDIVERGTDNVRSETKIVGIARAIPDPDPGPESGIRGISPPAGAPAIPGLPDPPRQPTAQPSAVLLAPPRAAYRPFPVGAATPAFEAVFDAYPRKDAKLKAAAVFQELAETYDGGEKALSASILASFAAGMLKRPPYAGPNGFRPLLETVLAERRWEDPQSAPDDPPTVRAGPADSRCGFHRAYGTLRKLPPAGAVEGCPTCREVTASRGTRTSEPEPPRFDLGPPPAAWTAEQIAEAEELRRGIKAG